MVDLENKQIVIQGKVEPILRFEVWWLVAFQGLFATLEEAQDLADDPRTLAPVPVAVSENLHEVMT